MTDQELNDALKYLAEIIEEKYIPKSKIERRLKELEAEEHSNYEYKAFQQGGIKELKGLLADE